MNSEDSIKWWNGRFWWYLCRFVNVDDESIFTNSQEKEKKIKEKHCIGFPSSMISRIAKQQRDDSVPIRNFEVREDETKNLGRHDEVEHRELKFRGFTWPSSARSSSPRTHEVRHLLLVAFFYFICSRATSLSHLASRFSHLSKQSALRRTWIEWQSM